ncbi:MAG: hypothetical protein IPJ23_17225 [Ignavibacteriales bacterium]|nr:hypothetical protein [Ignavibacteriales bacterium]
MFDGYKISSDEGDSKMGEFDNACSVLIKDIDELLKITEEKTTTSNTEMADMVSSSVSTTIVFVLLD